MAAQADVGQDRRDMHEQPDRRRRRPLYQLFRRSAPARWGFWSGWIALAGVLMALCWLLVKPAPPKKVVIATGPRDGAYDWFAQHYARTLAQSGITLDLRETAGSVENYRLLNSQSEQERGDNGVTVAMVQGGSAPEGMTTEIRSIASLYLEPIWIFYRGQTMHDIPDLRGRRIAVGPEGSGSREIALRLLRANGMATGNASPGAPTTTTSPTTTAATNKGLGGNDKPSASDRTILLPLAGASAKEALRSGQIDAFIMVINPRAPIVAELLRASSDGVHLLSIDRHAAYARRFSYLSDVTLPRGTIDLQHDLPAADVHLLAPAANLVIRNGVHPAIVTLLLEAVGHAHERGDLLSAPGAFPSTRFVEFPVDPAAQDYFHSGVPFLYRYLPFWAAALVGRMKILLLPLITLLIPLTRVAPPLYVWSIRSRIYRWYRVLREVDLRLRDTENLPADQRPRSFERELAMLKEMERELGEEKVPLSYMQEFYHLRLHAEFLRKRIEQRMAGAAAPGETPVETGGTAAVGNIPLV